MNGKTMAQLFRIFVFLLVLISTDAFALGSVSRACRWDWIPGALRPAAAALFYQLGMPESKYKDVLAHPEKAKKYWILESITADYGSARYYLFVENRIYRYSPYTYNNGPGVPVTNGWAYTEYTGYKSAGWTSWAVSKEMYEDSRFQVFFHNRGLLTSARAGHPEIVQYFEADSRIDADSWIVRGEHYYYDAVNKIQGNVPSTTVYSNGAGCNLGEWAFGDR